MYYIDINNASAAATILKLDHSQDLEFRRVQMLNFAYNLMFAKQWIPLPLNGLKFPARIL